MEGSSMEGGEVLVGRALVRGGGGGASYISNYNA